MKIEHVLNCSFEQWYDRFKNLTIKSEIIPIDDEVLSYLRSDETIILPESCHYKKSTRKQIKNDYDTDDSDTAINSDDDFGEDETKSNENTKKYNFPEFDNALKSALEKFDEKVFIKLNWSSPKDAHWSLNKLSCDCLRDIYILLRSSDFINHDLNEPFDKCDENTQTEKSTALESVKYYLIIRKWMNINPGGEFRCFVKDNRLIGISQRDCRTFHLYLNENQDKIMQLVKNFYLENIHGKFNDSSFIFDIYIKKNNSIVLLDFNPYGQVTDTLLFDWNELNCHDNDDVLFRCVEDEDKCIKENQYSMYQMPKDIIDIVHGGDSEKLLDLVKMQVEMQKKEDEM